MAVNAIPLLIERKMLDKIISSKSRIVILSLFFANQEKSFYAQEIVNKTGLDPANVKKELENLLSGGFLIIKKEKGKKLFEINKENDLYAGLNLVFEKYHGKREEWFIMEEMLDYYPMLVTPGWNAKKANDFLKKMGLKNKFTKLFARYDNGMTAILTLKNEFSALAEEVVSKLINDIKWSEKYLEEVFNRQKKIVEANTRLSQENLANYDERGLLDLYKKHYSLYEDMHIVHWVQSVADFGENVLSKYLMNYLEGKIGSKEYSLGEVFSVLTTPIEKGTPTNEYEGLLKLLGYIKNSKKLEKYFCGTETRIIVSELNKIDPILDKKIDDHVVKYGWLGYGSVGPGWGREYFIDLLGSLLRQKTDYVRLLADIENSFTKMSRRQKELLDELNIDEKHKKLFEISKKMVFAKGSRKDAMYFFWSVIDNLYKEIGKRNYLSVGQVHYMYPWEFDSLLLKGKFSTEVLNDRRKYSIYYSEEDHKNDRILVGREAVNFWESLNVIKEEPKNIKILTGDCASPGKARGEAKVINTVKDMAKFKEGDVLVSIATTPDLVSAMRKASAIVTDMGGITCHAAIVSRELGIPCVIGTKFATKILKDGTTVDVDATHGKVTIIKKGK